MDILLTGGGGQLGTALRSTALASGLMLHTPSRQQLDLTRPDSIQAMLASRPWAAIINAAAYTAVDRAESEPALAWAVNATAPALLAAHAAAHGVALVHVSTDYVYDGEKADPYVEADSIGPLGVYGASKAAAEIAIAASGARHFIARTSWVVSPFGANFVKTMLRLGAERPELRIVADQRGAPTSADDLAALLVAVTARLLTDPKAPIGVFHTVNSGETTWFGVAEAVFRRAAHHGLVAPALTPIATAQYPTPAKRPANSRLDAGKLRREYGLAAAPWEASINRIVDRLLSAAPGA